MGHEPVLCCIIPEGRNSQRTNAGSPVELPTIHLFRVFSNIGVILFHTFLLWAVVGDTTMEDSLQVRCCSCYDPIPHVVEYETHQNIM